MYYTYILRCKNGSLYTGYTVDIKRRLEEHKQGINCKYTRANGFKSLEMCFISNSKSDAMKVEYYIKKLSKNKKESIIITPEVLISELNQIKNISISIYEEK